MFKTIKLACITLAVMTATAMAQAPSQINYQGVARDASGVPISNQQIKIRLKVRDLTSNGTVLYSEVRKPTTNSGGLFNISIGSGGAISTTGSFASIPWATGNKYLQVEMDPTGGTAYQNMGTQQMLSVPYAQHANTASTIETPMTAIDSTSAAMITLNNKNQNAMEAYSTNGMALYGWSNNHTAISGANSSNSTAITGFNYGAGNGILGYSEDGIGVVGNNGNATWPAIVGNNSLGIGVKGQTIAATGSGVEGTNSGGGAGVKGVVTHANGVGVSGNNTAGGTGVIGITNNGTSTSKGVYGTAINGIGVAGNSEYIAVQGTTLNGTALYGNSYTGSAIYGYSATGYALNVGGKIKITGPGQTPGAGKVLTSDASGNASWQSPGARVAFRSRSINNTYKSMPDATWKKVEYQIEEYDLTSSFVHTPGSNSSTTSCFTVPVSGIYHFDAQVNLTYNIIFDVLNADIKLMVYRNGASSVLVQNNNSPRDTQPDNSSVSSDLHVLAGDIIWVEFYQSNTSFTSSDLETGGQFNYFGGHLLYAD